MRRKSRCSTTTSTVDVGWLEPLRGRLRADETLGAVQPKLLMAGSVPARVNSVGVAIDAAGAGSDIGFGELDGPAFATIVRSSRSRVVPCCSAREFLDDTDGFDESYFLYYEDADLARRGAELGWTYRCVPASVVRHRVSASTAQLGDRARYLQERNRLRFVFRYGDAAMIRRAVWLSVRRVRWRPRWVHARALATGCCIRARCLCWLAAPRAAAESSVLRIAFIRTLCVVDASRVLQLFDAASPPPP